MVKQKKANKKNWPLRASSRSIVQAIDSWPPSHRSPHQKPLSIADATNLKPFTTEIPRPKEKHLSRKEIPATDPRPHLIERSTPENQISLNQHISQHPTTETCPKSPQSSTTIDGTSSPKPQPHHQRNPHEPKLCQTCSSTIPHTSKRHAKNIGTPSTSIFQLTSSFPLS